ncbi:putative cellulose synthase-like protein G2-like [Capsicum annuum]|nr:putative cellulose synthase-like protein G2-like [Capsicum annuum]
MSKKYDLPFKARQFAEALSFENGFRGAWFRCKLETLIVMAENECMMIEDVLKLVGDVNCDGEDGCWKFGYKRGNLRVLSRAGLKLDIWSVTHRVVVGWMKGRFTFGVLSNLIIPPRLEIHKISFRRGHWNALLEFFDYPDEKLTWTKLYQYPPYNVGKSKEKMQLMLRPQYPSVKLKIEISDISSVSEATVVSDGNWQAGDLVDWWANGCYWSGRLIKLLGSNEAELALTPPPVGEGASYEISFKDLRPSLDWSPDFGWNLPTSQEATGSSFENSLLQECKDGDGVRQCARLIQPVNLAFGRFPAVEIHSMSDGRTGSSSDLSFATHSSASLSPVSDKKTDFKTTELAERPPISDLPKKSRSCSHTGDESAKESSSSDKDASSCIGVDPAKASAEPTDNFNYSSCPFKKCRTSDQNQLHSMGSDTTEAAIMDLEELVSKIKWLKGLLEFGRPPVAKRTWKFVEHHTSSGNE